MGIYVTCLHCPTNPQVINENYREIEGRLHQEREEKILYPAPSSGVFGKGAGFITIA
jgi:hypothetical protein